VPKNEVEPLLYSIHKNVSKWINNLNIRVKSIKLLGENIRVNLHNFGFHNGFLAMIPKA
jgi:hypothetical protein